MQHIIEFENQQYLDHIAWGVADFDKAIKQFTNMTGVEPYVPNQENAPYKSAGVLLNSNQTIEIIGPNLDFDGEHSTFSKILMKMPEPQLIFWYVGATDFDGMADDVRQNGFRLMREEHVNAGFTEDMDEFRRAMIMPTFKMQRDVIMKRLRNVFSQEKMLAIMGFEFPMVMPQMIQYIQRSKPRAEKYPSGITLKAFNIMHPQPEMIQSAYDQLGVPMTVQYAPKPTLQLILDTPKGIVTL